MNAIIRRNSIVVCAIASVMVASLAQGDDIRYQQSGDWFDADLTDSIGWQSAPNLPGAADTARINWGGNTVTLSGIAPNINHLQTGVDESGTLVINSGGSLTSLGWSMIGANGGTTTGALTINNGGVMNIGEHLWVGVGSSTGIIDINNGGILNVSGILGLGTVDAVNPSGGLGFLNINDGGLFNLNNIHSLGTSIQTGSLLNISGSGVMTLPGDFTGVINNYVAAGQIVGNGVPDQVQAIFDSGLNKTLVTAVAVPEPTNFALAAFAGLALVLRRIVRKS